LYCSLRAVKVLLATLRSTLTVLARRREVAYRFTQQNFGERNEETTWRLVTGNLD